MSHAKHLVHAAIGAASILAIGVVVGVALDRVVLLHGDSAPHGAIPTDTLDAGHSDLLRELGTELGMTDAQASQVHEILTRHQEAVDEAWAAVHSRLASAIDSVTAEIEAILEPEQRDRLFEWLRERHAQPPHDLSGEAH